VLNADLVTFVTVKFPSSRHQSCFLAFLFVNLSLSIDGLDQHKRCDGLLRTARSSNASYRSCALAAEMLLRRKVDRRPIDHRRRGFSAANAVVASIDIAGSRGDIVGIRSNDPHESCHGIWEQRSAKRKAPIYGRPCCDLHGHGDRMFSFLGPMSQLWAPFLSVKLVQ
ncbi:unnamed protein product, partial [Tilletia laevis]